MESSLTLRAIHHHFWLLSSPLGPPFCSFSYGFGPSAMATLGVLSVPVTC